MYSPKTLTLALLVASIATSSFARFAPDRDGIHGSRADDVLPASLTQDTVQFIKSAAAKALFGGGVKATLNDIQNHIKNNTDSVQGSETQDLNTRTVPLHDISPSVADLIKGRELGALSDDDLRLLSRQLIEGLN